MRKDPFVHKYVEKLAWVINISAKESLLSSSVRDLGGNYKEGWMGSEMPSDPKQKKNRRGQYQLQLRKTSQRLLKLLKDRFKADDKGESLRFCKAETHVLPVCRGEGTQHASGSCRFIESEGSEPEGSTRFVPARTALGWPDVVPCVENVSKFTNTQHESFIKHYEAEFLEIIIFM
jgi:hypothetical protein